MIIEARGFQPECRTGRSFVVRLRGGLAKRHRSVLRIAVYVRHSQICREV